MTNNPLENICNEFTKTRKTGPLMESLTVEFFQFSAMNTKKFVLNS